MMSGITRKGASIEAESFAIIDREAGPHDFTPEEWEVVRRVIHTTADLEFKNLVRFRNGALAAGIAAFQKGAPVICDVKMLAAGVNRLLLEKLGSKVHVFISDEDVSRDAHASGSTKAASAMQKARRLGILEGGIVAVGNAPTALLEIERLVLEENARPALVVGVPVGFVSAAESKEAFARLPLPSIITTGRKGGSPIAVAILNAIMKIAAGERGL